LKPQISAIDLKTEMHTSDLFQGGRMRRRVRKKDRQYGKGSL